jgi:hypothetical protein
MRNLVTGLALGRIVVGAVMLINPEASVRTWIGRRAASYSGTQTITRAFGARDLSLGAGALAALVTGRDARDWVIAGAFADVADLGATLAADDLPLAGRLGVAALAGTAIAVSGGYVLSGDAREPAQ